jgi:hypothetical protein
MDVTVPDDFQPTVTADAVAALVRAQSMRFSSTLTRLPSSLALLQHVCVLPVR